MQLPPVRAEHGNRVGFGHPAPGTAVLVVLQSQPVFAILQNQRGSILQNLNHAAGDPAVLNAQANHSTQLFQADIQLAHLGQTLR